LTDAVSMVFSFYFGLHFTLNRNIGSVECMRFLQVTPVSILQGGRGSSTS